MPTRPILRHREDHGGGKETARVTHGAEYRVNRYLVETQRIMISTPSPHFRCSCPCARRDPRQGHGSENASTPVLARSYRKMHAAMPAWRANCCKRPSQDWSPIGGLSARQVPARTPRLHPRSCRCPGPPLVDAPVPLHPREAVEVRAVRRRPIRARARCPKVRLPLRRNPAFFASRVSAPPGCGGGGATTPRLTARERSTAPSPFYAGAPKPNPLGATLIPSGNPR
jgi:hypothetical protein